MAKVQPITSINVDEVDIPVKGLPDGIKSLVSVYEEWTQREIDAADELQLVRAAKQQLGQQIVQSYRQYQAELAAAAQTTEDRPEPAPGPVTAEDLKEEPENTVAVTGDDTE